MIKISSVKLGLQEETGALLQKSAKLLGVSPKEIKDYRILKQSIDARKKSEIHYTYTLELSLGSEKDEERILKRTKSRQVSASNHSPYLFPPVKHRPEKPVVVGMGPCGLFAALMLARAGLPPVIVERGNPVEQRLEEVEQFWRGGELSPQSNVQFGEGGAGTFSDGKLTTGTKDPRNQELFRILVEMGAPADIEYSHKPHIGSDVLHEVLKNLRQELLSLGCEIRYGQQMVGLERSGDQVTAVRLRHQQGEELLPASHVVCAIGHSARDSFTMLYELGVPMEPKSFAVGARIEHLQEDMGRAQYGEAYTQLPPPDYKLACHLPSGRSLFSFCVCPGGVVVNASSQPGQMVTNGMSYRARNLPNINGGLLVGLRPEDFQAFEGNVPQHPLAGMYFQEHWEQQAYQVGQGKAVCQQVGDFLQKRASTGCGKVKPSFTSGVVYGDIRDCLPPFVAETMAEGIPHLGNKIPCFSQEEALLTAIETRSSSPLRILRDENFQSSLKGFYPCGEGAGYAGGIVSAAVDGMKVAEALVSFP